MFGVRFFSHKTTCLFGKMNSKKYNERGRMQRGVHADEFLLYFTLYRAVVDYFKDVHSNVYALRTAKNGRIATWPYAFN